MSRADVLRKLSAALAPGRALPVRLAYSKKEVLEALKHAAGVEERLEKAGEPPDERILRLAKQGGWIGVDFDGTLAVRDLYATPIPTMVARVKAWRAAGIEVRVVTARATADIGGATSVKAWCVQHIGEELPVTDRKDHMMIELWDDRAVQVVTNTGLRADQVAAAGQFDESRLDELAMAAAHGEGRSDP